MGTPAHVVRVLHFGVFEVDLKACEIRKHGVRLKLPEQPFQVLSVLLENPGEIVTRDELRTRLWLSDTFVDFDHGLNNAVMRLREVLGDSSENPRFVETIPRRGYRFIAPVAGLPATYTIQSQTENGHLAVQAAKPQLADPLAAEVRSEPTGRLWPPTARWAAISAAIFLACVLGAIAFYRYQRSGAGKIAPPQNKSLVVLPLENLSGDKDQ